MAHKRKCRQCLAWFTPSPRAAAQQRTCSKPACQQARHAKACAAWRKKNPTYHVEIRLRERLAAKSPDEMPTNVERAIDWPAAQRAVGVAVGVLAEVVCEAVTSCLSAQDAVPRRARVVGGESAIVPRVGPQDAVPAKSGRKPAESRIVPPTPAQDGFGSQGPAP